MLGRHLFDIPLDIKIDVMTFENSILCLPAVSVLSLLETCCSVHEGSADHDSIRGSVSLVHNNTYP